MKTSIFNEIKDYSLSNLDNYNKTFDYKADEVINKYILLSNEFLKFILEKIKIKNNHYSKFIIIRGYETLTNIFNIKYVSLHFSRHFSWKYRWISSWFCCWIMRWSRSGWCL